MSVAALLFDTPRKTPLKRKDLLSATPTALFLSPSLKSLRRIRPPSSPLVPSAPPPPPQVDDDDDADCSSDETEARASVSSTA